MNRDKNSLTTSCGNNSKNTRIRITTACDWCSKLVSLSCWLSCSLNTIFGEYRTCLENTVLAWRIPYLLLIVILISTSGINVMVINLVHLVLPKIENAHTPERRLEEALRSLKLFLLQKDFWKNSWISELPFKVQLNPILVLIYLNTHLLPLYVQVWNN